MTPDAIVGALLMTTGLVVCGWMILTRTPNRRFPILMGLWLIILGATQIAGTLLPDGRTRLALVICSGIFQLGIAVLILRDARGHRRRLRRPR